MNAVNSRLPGKKVDFEHEGIRYKEEVELPNGHKWRRRDDGGWCRFSNKRCFPTGKMSGGEIQANSKNPPFPKAPTGYHWRSNKSGTPTLVKNANTDGGQLSFDPSTNRFKPKTQKITPRLDGNLSGGPLAGATKHQGNFPIEGGPANGILYRSKNTGEITNYATYDSNGMILKRVDVDPNGAPHRGIEPPHVITYTRNPYIDADGNKFIRVQKPNSKGYPRPARPDEIP